MTDTLIERMRAAIQEENNPQRAITTLQEQEANSNNLYNKIHHKQKTATEELKQFYNIYMDDSQYENTDLEQLLPLKNSLKGHSSHFITEENNQYKIKPAYQTAAKTASRTGITGILAAYPLMELNQPTIAATSLAIGAIIAITGELATDYLRAQQTAANEMNNALNNAKDIDLLEQTYRR